MTIETATMTQSSVARCIGVLLPQRAAPGFSESGDGLELRAVPGGHAADDVRDAREALLLEELVAIEERYPPAQIAVTARVSRPARAPARAGRSSGRSRAWAMWPACHSAGRRTSRSCAGLPLVEAMLQLVHVDLLGRREPPSRRRARRELRRPGSPRRSRARRAPAACAPRRRCSSSSATRTIGSSAAIAAPRPTRRTAPPRPMLSDPGTCPVPYSAAGRASSTTAPASLQRLHLVGRQRGRLRQLGEAPGALAVDLHVAREVRRRLGQVRRHHLDELLAGHRLERVVEPALLADRRATSRWRCCGRTASRRRARDRPRRSPAASGASRGASRRACRPAPPRSSSRRGGRAGRRRR